MKVIKEKQLFINPNMLIKYGTTQRCNPEVIYVSSKFWIEPLEEIEFENVFEDIRNEFRQELTCILRNQEKWQNKFISDFDIKSNGIQTNKKSFVSIEFYIKQNSKMMRNFKSLECDMINDFTNLFDNLQENLSVNNIRIYQNKKAQ